MGASLMMSKYLMKRFSDPPAAMKQISDDGRCNGKRTGKWGNFGKGLSEEACKQACEDKGDCEYVVFRTIKGGICTEFATCGGFKAKGKGFKAFHKTSKADKDEDTSMNNGATGAKKLAVKAEKVATATKKISNDGSCSGEEAGEIGKHTTAWGCRSACLASAA